MLIDLLHESWIDENLILSKQCENHHENHDFTYTKELS